MTLNTHGSSDKDFFDLFKYYEESNILSENENLLAQLRQYVEKRFDYMDREMILKYLEFLKDLGMFFEDKILIEKLDNYF
jgi:hypothetical protein